MVEAVLLQTVQFQSSDSFDTDLFGADTLGFSTKSLGTYYLLLKLLTDRSDNLIFLRFADTVRSQEEEQKRTLLRNNSPTNPALLVRLSIVQSRPLYCLIVNFTMQKVEAGNDRSFILSYSRASLTLIFFS